MTAIAKKIEEEIQQLPLEDMLALHEHLIVTIHESEEARTLDPAFRAEIQRRVDEIDSGKVQGTDALEALKQM
ncbi:MAG: addiction module protein [Verrucomicrobiota bacterium]|jgi:putative addiction module component (TIGR02574 family)